MIIWGRSPTMRHVSRTHRVALDWLFDRISLDPEIQINYIDTKLTKGNFTRDEWNHLLCLFKISHFSSINNLDVEKNTRRCRWRNSPSKIKADDEFGITIQREASERAKSYNETKQSVLWMKFMTTKKSSGPVTNCSQPFRSQKERDLMEKKEEPRAPRKLVLAPLSIPPPRASPMSTSNMDTKNKTCRHFWPKEVSQEMNGIIFFLCSTQWVSRCSLVVIIVIFCLTIRIESRAPCQNEVKMRLRTKALRWRKRDHAWWRVTRGVRKSLHEVCDLWSIREYRWKKRSRSSRWKQLAGGATSNTPWCKETCAECVNTRTSEHGIHEPSVHEQDLSVGNVGN